MIKKILLTVSVLFLTTSCLTSVKNGIIPAQYIDAAQPYMGTYQGNLNGVNSTLVMSIENSGRVNLAITSQNGTFLPQCQAYVGRLLSINGDKDHMILKTAIFQFAADSNCGIEGRTLRLDFRANSAIYLSIIEKTSYDTFFCGSNLNYSPYYGPYGYRDCGFDNGYRVDSWIRGIYSKEE